MMAHSRIDARGVLVDLDGTVYESGAAIPGARSNESIPRTNEIPGNPVRFTRLEWEGRRGTCSVIGG